MRCMHLDRGGWQCPAEALEGRDFCVDHLPVLEAAWLEHSRRYPLPYRLAALVLLLIFLLNAYQTVSSWLGS